MEFSDAFHSNLNMFEYAQLGGDPYTILSEVSVIFIDV
jgi:hypothetical protein